MLNVSCRLKKKCKNKSAEKIKYFLKAICYVAFFVFLTGGFVNTQLEPTLGPNLADKYKVCRNSRGKEVYVTTEEQ